MRWLLCMATYVGLMYLIFVPFEFVPIEWISGVGSGLLFLTIAAFYSKQWRAEERETAPQETPITLPLSNPKYGWKSK